MDVLEVVSYEGQLLVQNDNVVAPKVNKDFQRYGLRMVQLYLLVASHRLTKLGRLWS